MTRINYPVLHVLFSLILILQIPAGSLAGITFVPGQGLVLTGADGMVLTGADGMVLTGADGMVLTGADGMVLTGADALVLTGADALTYTGVDALVLSAADSVGLQGIDPELALKLDQLPDSSAINVFVIFHDIPTDADLNDLRPCGILGGTRFRNLPIVLINATKTQVEAISNLPSVRSLYSNKTFEFFTNDTRTITGQAKLASDSSLLARNGGIPLFGRGVTVAVLDTGIDTAHADLPFGTRVVENVRMADLQGSAPDFLYPSVVTGIPNTDPVMGHGTFAAGVIAGGGTASGGYYGGMAPGADLLGVAIGDASLFYVLAGIDYILSCRSEKNIRVVNCSFGIAGLFDANDPVNIATRIMHDAGITVVFSAGNRGDQPNSLNPYSAAPWVIGVGSGTKTGKLSDFSSRGAAAYGTYHPTLIAPGEHIVSARASGVNVVATAGLSEALISPENDAIIPSSYLPSYTMSSGTSFAAPHVVGTIALMLEGNPRLTPDHIKRILQETATPMLGYSRYEVGAGYLNTYAAVQRAVLDKQFGAFRGFLNQGVTYSREPLVQFGGMVAPGSSYTATLQIPEDSVFSTVQVCWTNGDVSGTVLSVSLSHGDEIMASKPACLLAGAGVQRTGVTVAEPTAGAWTITVQNQNSLSSAPQEFVGAIEIFRGSYPDISDITYLSSSERDAIKRSLRTGLIKRSEGGFAPSLPATRLDAARAIVLGAGALVPQYLPQTPSFSDLPPGESELLIESAVNSPAGNLFETVGPYFQPQSTVDRLTAAIAMVKALRLRSLASEYASSNPGISDWNSIPESSRGYVALAVSMNLIDLRGANFDPFNSMTRGELAMSASALQRAAR